jgi:hypothetical protein
MVLINVAGLLDTMTEKWMAEAIRERENVKFAEAMTQLRKIRFTDLEIDAGTVHSLKTIRDWRCGRIQSSAPMIMRPS